MIVGTLCISQLLLSLNGERMQLSLTEENTPKFILYTVYVMVSRFLNILQFVKALSKCDFQN